MTSNLKKIYVIVCNGISDIGKAWLTASIARLAPGLSLPVKIDPLLNLSFPHHLGVPLTAICAPSDIAAFARQTNIDPATYKVSEDMGTYHSAGITVYPECNIVAGDLIQRFVLSPDTNIRPGETKKRTFSDLSRFLAQELTNIVKARHPEILLVEVGGTIEDPESVYIPGAFRFLREPEFLGIEPNLILLTYFEYAESFDMEKYRLKTQIIRRGIAHTKQKYYDLPLGACIVRRRTVPEAVPDEILLKDLENVAYETQIPVERIVYVPNMHKLSLTENLSEISQVLASSGLF